jgi:HSP20 family protein
MALTPRETIEILQPLRDAIGHLVDVTNREVEEGRLHPHIFDLFSAGQPLPADLLEVGDGYVVEIAAPGVEPSSVYLIACAQSLTVRVDWRKHEDAEAGGSDRRYLRRERYSGETTRVIALPSPIDPERATAYYERGIVRVRAPKSEQVKAIEVAVDVHEVGPLRSAQ